MATGLPTELPRGKRIIVVNNKPYLTSKGRGKRYKTPAKVRRKIAAGLRRMYVPGLTVGALAIGLHKPVAEIFAGRWANAGNYMMTNYTGFNPVHQNWEFKRLFGGLIPLVGVMLINRWGILKPVNQKLARMRIPFRLS